MATYIPNATQTTEPVESRTVESAALEFRTLKASVNSRVATVQSNLDAETAARIAGDTAETAARIAGDANLQAQNNAQDVRLTAIENALPFIGEGAVPGTVYVQRFSGTGAQTAFTLDVVPQSGNVVDIYINGLYQNKNTFSVAGAVITFSEAPPAGTNNIEVQVTVSIALGETDASLVDFQQAGTGAVARTVQAKLREWVSVKDFGAVGDGVTDDTAAIQAALDSNRVVCLPPGKYRTTSTLFVDPIRNRNTGFVGLTNATRYPYTQQTGGPTWNGGQEPVIFYDGPASATAAVICASSEPVGIEPASTFDTTIWTLTLRDFTLDANGKAGYGLFAARVQDLNIHHLRARGATIAGMSINGTYSGSCYGARCYLNPGRGFELGGADSRYGWSVNDKVNAFYIYDLHADANGSSATFRESDPVLRKDNCGVYFGPHRSTHIYGIVSENNFGANIVFEPTSSGNTINGYYTELGCKYAPGGAGTDAISLGYATKQWGVIFVGAVGALNCRLVDGVTGSDAIWLTGTEPSSRRKESGFEIYNNSLASAGLTADWGNYRLVNCALELETITGTQPVGAYTINGGLQFGSGSGVLSEYEEGTFVPALAGLTTPGTGWAYSLQAASYTRIGRMVFVSGRIALTAVSGDATGQITITGLPFTVRNANNFQSSAPISNVRNMGVNVVAVEGSAQINGTKILLHKRTAASASAGPVILTDLTATTLFHFSLAYVAA